MDTNRLILAFLRHGEYHQSLSTPSAFQPYPLTDGGRLQSVSAAQQIIAFAEHQALSIHPVIHSSNLLRAWQTADVIAQNLAFKALIPERKVESDAQLNERSVGALANLTLSQIETVVKNDSRHNPLPEGWKSDSAFCLPVDGAESLLEAGQRVADFIESQCISLLSEQDEDCLKIMVGHGAAFRHAAYLMGLLSFEQVSRYSMHYASPIYFELTMGANHSVSWRHLAGDWKLRYTDSNDSQPILID
ncbi:MAG: histidine phosphatase family protein [Thiomicrorhabdus chilensis]|uniref:histidine phosphatase family protein n=1 Tax=Thiomicrorhabdus chilensis TaxID=63656 RepID=UPI00299D5586|nr:histidine phosphatase family protein [Thiomicrorhabdus chilensis]MDX1347397.1 histidine phosphatase family protein [Thiomicrorhabdus chilensis]